MNLHDSYSDAQNESWIVTSVCNSVNCHSHSISYTGVLVSGFDGVGLASAFSTRILSRICGSAVCICILFWSNPRSKGRSDRKEQAGRLAYTCTYCKDFSETNESVLVSSKRTRNEVEFGLRPRGAEAESWHGVHEAIS